MKPTGVSFSEYRNLFSVDRSSLVRVTCKGKRVWGLIMRKARKFQVGDHIWGGPPIVENMKRSRCQWGAPYVSLHSSYAHVTVPGSEIENSLRQARLNLFLRALSHDLTTSQ